MSAVAEQAALVAAGCGPAVGGGVLMSMRMLMHSCVVHKVDAVTFFLAI